MHIKKIAMHKTTINFDSPRWQKIDANIGNKVKKILKKSVQIEKKFSKKNTEISVLLTDTKLMKKLNYKFRKKNKDTDILSFPSERRSFYKKSIKEKKIYLGDLALSYGYIKKQKTDFMRYFKKILVHGYLHLLGYDHDNTKNFLKMEKAQDKILKIL